MKFIHLTALLICCAAFAGCASVDDIFGRTDSSTRSVDTVAAKQAYANQAMETNIQRILAQLDEVQRLQATQENRLQALERTSPQDDIIALRRDMAALRASNENLRKEIVDDLSARMAKMQTATTPTRTTTTTTAKARSGGYEHKVEKGQTLSEIARGYNTTVKAIMDANNLKQNSVIRVGQTLFIPD